ncbi:MAG: CBS domain-containing protein [Myxococcota bacterium]
MEVPRVREFMIPVPLTLRPETPIYDAIASLARLQISGAPVVDADGQLVGFLSERDCLRILSNWAVQQVPGGAVADYMTHEVETVLPEFDLMALASHFEAREFRQFPVCDHDGALVGQIRCRDVLRAIHEMGKVPSPYPDYRRPQ